MSVSIIIPTLNEAANIQILIPYLLKNGNATLSDIIVVDADSPDKTAQIAASLGAKTIICPERCRAIQMNAGAAIATGDVLYFIHADCLPPPTFLQDIEESIAQGFSMGCYRYKFNSSHLMLKINAYFTRFSPLWCRGGDETLFIKKEVFEGLGGFNPYYVIMEEYDLIKRAWKEYAFKIMPKYAQVSARKYEKNGWLKVQLANLNAFKMFNKGVPPQEIAAVYKRKLS
jgi:rSAM/selenodomain-associated transferase 2